jgi:hypothetical protein
MEGAPAPQAHALGQRRFRTGRYRRGLEGVHPMSVAAVAGDVLGPDNVLAGLAYYKAPFLQDC